MNQQVKAKWINALRSGEYQQGKRTLRDRDSYCCLGVLCDLYQKETGEGYWGNSIYDPTYSVFSLPDGNESKVLPRKVADWAGLLSSNPIMKVKTEALGTVYRAGRGDESLLAIAEVNDHGLGGFEKIAELIEDQL